MELGDFLVMLATEIGKVGSAKKAAEEWGVSAQYLSDVLRGQREPGPKILDEFGLYKRVTYEEKDRSCIGFAKEATFGIVPIKPSGPKFMTVEKEQP